MKPDKRKNRFLVGFKGDHQCIYGRPDHQGHGDYTHPMTAKGAERHVATMGDGTVAIYELVPVKVIRKTGKR